MQTSRNLYQQNLTTLLRAVADTTQADVGLAAGHDKSWVSRFLHGEGKANLEELMRMLEASGLQLVFVDQVMVSVPAEEHQALVTFAAKGLQAYKQAGAL